MEEEDRDRSRQSEIYAQPDAVFASLVRITVVTTVKGIKRQRIAGFREMRERACVFSDCRIYRRAEIERGIVKYLCGLDDCARELSE